MGLLDDVRDRSDAARRGALCSVGVWLAAQTATIQDEFNAALDSDANATLICDVIREKYGFSRGASTVQRHRRGGCDCEPRG